MRQYSGLDRFLSAVDEGCRVAFGFDTEPHLTPEECEEDSSLSDRQRRHSASLMRVNHAGEVAAQGLYHGQALTAHSTETESYMRKGAHEEKRHLLWCAERLHALHSRPSLLTPVWYWGSFGIGCLAGLMGDRWSLGFIKETEDQVVEHLSSHLRLAPCHDQKTIDVIERIRTDELEHAKAAATAGAHELPTALKKLMQKTAKIMTGTAWYF